MENIGKYFWNKSWYSYNFIINIENIDENADATSLIQLQSENVSEENDISKFINNKKDENKQDHIGELYSKQILRALRVLYFIILKYQEKHLLEQLHSSERRSESYKILKFRLFYITMQLSSFDDMNNYNNTIKTAIDILIEMINDFELEKDQSTLIQLTEVMINYYRSDMIHRRLQKWLTTLRTAIEQSNIPDNTKEAMLQTLDNNCWNTLDNIDAVKRFEFLLKEKEYIEYLSLFQISLNKFANRNENNLAKQCQKVLKTVDSIKLKFLQICHELKKSLNLSFGYSYVFKKGHSWNRIPNIFNLSNSRVSRVDSPKVRHEFIQQRSHKIEMNQEEEIIESDILPMQKADDDMK